jgi:hypothetical protein
MKTKKQVLKEHPNYSDMINSVISRIGMESVPDVIRGGISGGFNGFTYTCDCVDFFRLYREKILELLVEFFESTGDSILETVGSFSCLNYYNPKSKRWNGVAEQVVIGQTLYGGPVDDQVANALAWFAAELVCNWFED